MAEGDTDAAIASLEQALRLKREIGDVHGEAIALLNLTLACQRADRLELALWHGDACLELVRQHGLTEMEPNVAIAIADINSLLHNYAKALDLAEAARTAWEKRGEREHAAWALDSQARACVGLGRPAEAVAHGNEAVAMFLNLGEFYHAAETLLLLGDVHESAGSIADARSSTERAVTLLVRLDHPMADQARDRLTELGRVPVT